MKWRRSGVVGAWVLGALLDGCYVGPSVERIDCLQHCAQGKDRCLLEASTAAEVEQCDVESMRCSAPCPA